MYHISSVLLQSVQPAFGAHDFWRSLSNWAIPSCSSQQLSTDCVFCYGCCPFVQLEVLYGFVISFIVCPESPSFTKKTKRQLGILCCRRFVLVGHQFGMGVHVGRERGFEYHGGYSNGNNHSGNLLLVPFFLLKFPVQFEGNSKDPSYVKEAVFILINK